MEQQNYSEEQQNRQQPYHNYYPPRKKSRPWLWILISVAGLVALIVLAAVFGEDSEGSLPYKYQPHIAGIYVEGTIIGNDNHDFLLRTIDDLAENDNNLALLVYLDTPGGEILASDELAQKIVAYRQQTGRPVYMYGHNSMASGGYWIACAGDRVYAHKYCTTGSIGVAFGSIFDISGLLEKLGIRVNTITSGDQKSMGSSFEEMDEETRAILETIISEYYGDFVSWVASSRSLSLEDVQSLADGRIYTARQAFALELIDEVGTYADALADLQQQLGAEYPVQDYLPAATTSIWEQIYWLQYQNKGSESLLQLLPPSGPMSSLGGQ
jgi:protease-4